MCSLKKNTTVIIHLSIRSHENLDFEFEFIYNLIYDDID